MHEAVLAAEQNARVPAGDALLNKIEIRLAGLSIAVQAGS